MSLKFAFYALIGVVAVALVGLRLDTDICTYTSEEKSNLEFFGLRLISSNHLGFRPWIEGELGLKIGSRFVDYSDTFPLFAPRSTPPGNWMFLRSAHSLYRENPDSRTAIKELLREVAAREPPLVAISDYDALNLIRDPEWEEKLEEHIATHEQRQNKASHSSSDRAESK